MARKSSPLQRLHDILDAIDKIDRYAATRSVVDPVHASMVYDAVVRNIEVVSEATRHVPPDLPPLKNAIVELLEAGEA